nr:MAG TPA: hypothetical protein [Caudoviricetes sp.]
MLPLVFDPLNLLSPTCRAKTKLILADGKTRSGL